MDVDSHTSMHNGSDVAKSSTDPLRIVKRPSTFSLDSAESTTRTESNGHVASSGSITGQVRQRISKDMIRARMEERRAVHSVPPADVTESPTEFAFRQFASGERNLPPPPSADDVQINVNTRRPPLSGTQGRSAQDVLAESTKDGVLQAPKSALDQLASGLFGTVPPNGVDTDKAVVRPFASTNVSTPTKSQTPRAASSSARPIPDTDDMVLNVPTEKPRRKRSMSTGDARPPRKNVRREHSCLVQ